MPSPERLNTRSLREGRFLRLEEVTFRDRFGRERTWEAAMRKNNQGAVQVIPHMMPSDRYLLIRQYRPPVGRFVVEFPAGLIDPGESPETTAVRELLEETGYRGTIRWVSHPTCSSPGMTGESVALAFAEIDEEAPENADPTPELEDGEDIDVFCVPTTSLGEFLAQQEADGARIDSRTAAFAMGLGRTW